MSAADAPARRRQWAAAAVAGVLLAGAAAGFMRMAAAAGPISPPARGGALAVNWEGAVPERAVAQEAQLMDPSVLFLPSAVTAAVRPIFPRGAAVAFSRLAQWERPELAFQSHDLRLALPSPMPMPSGPADALQTHPPGNPALGFGRTDAAPPALPPRAAWVEVSAAATGEILLRSTVPVGPVTSGGQGADWAPINFLITVTPAGLVGQSVDAPPGLEKRLDDELFLSHRFPPGSYRISVGP